MSKVAFSYVKGGKTVMMARRYAETLRKLGHGTYATGQPEAKAENPVEAPEPRASEAVIEFAKEHGVDLSAIIGTGKDGRIKKSDVEAVIASRDLV